MVTGDLMADFIWVTALRLLNALAVLVAPLPAFWLSGHLDRWDWTLLGMPEASQHDQQAYQYWDKCLDTLTLAVALFVALRWKDSLVRGLAIATFSWRLVGVTLFAATGDDSVLVLFPEVFGKLFLFYLTFRVLARSDLMLRSRADAIVTTLALAIPKVAEEYFIHVGSRPWQTITLLPASISTPDREYWVWMPMMLALPALAMLHLVVEARRASDEPRLPILTALLGRQIGASTTAPRPMAGVPAREWSHPVGEKVAGV